MTIIKGTFVEAGRGEYTYTREDPKLLVHNCEIPGLTLFGGGWVLDTRP